MFINKSDKIAVTAEGVVDTKDITPEIDVMYIKPKMDFGTKQRFTNALLDITSTGENTTTTYNLGTANIALLELNLVAWAGPSFQGVALSRENIEALDQDEPLVEKVLAELNDRNKAKSSPNGKASSGNG